MVVIVRIRDDSSIDTEIASAGNTNDDSSFTGATNTAANEFPVVSTILNSTPLSTSPIRTTTPSVIVSSSSSNSTAYAFDIRSGIFVGCGIAIVYLSVLIGVIYRRRLKDMKRQMNSFESNHSPHDHNNINSFFSSNMNSNDKNTIKPSSRTRWSWATSKRSINSIHPKIQREMKDVIKPDDQSLIKLPEPSLSNIVLPSSSPSSLSSSSLSSSSLSSSTIVIDVSEFPPTSHSSTSEESIPVRKSSLEIGPEPPKRIHSTSIGMTPSETFQMNHHHNHNHTSTITVASSNILSSLTNSSIAPEKKLLDPRISSPVDQLKMIPIINTTMERSSSLKRNTFGLISTSPHNYQYSPSSEISPPFSSSSSASSASSSSLSLLSISDTTPLMVRNLTCTECQFMYLKPFTESVLFHSRLPYSKMWIWANKSAKQCPKMTPIQEDLNH